MGNATKRGRPLLGRMWDAMEAGWRRGERGQMLMMFALLVVPITFILGAVAVDASVWQSERRGAQKDADLSALAGALELAFEQDQQNAESAAINAADTNDEVGSAPGITAGSDDGAANTVVVDDACFPGNTTLPLNAVTVNLDHDSQTFFSIIFGLDVAPDIGAHARACVGSLTNPEGLRPYAVDIETSPCFEQAPNDPDFEQPLFGAECVFDWGAQGSPGGAQRGLLDLETTAGPCSVNGGGANDVRDNIVDGAKGSCYTNPGSSCPTPLTTCVLGKSGNVSAVQAAVQTLIADADDCDTNGNGRDDFEESLELLGGGSAPPSPNNVYTPVTCSDGKPSERIITIIAVDSLEKNTDPWPIRYFLNIFIAGCRDSRDGPDAPLDPDCTVQNGNTRYYGIVFKSYLVEAGDITAPNDSGIRVVVLDE